MSKSDSLADALAGRAKLPDMVMRILRGLRSLLLNLVQRRPPTFDRIIVTTFDERTHGLVFKRGESVLETCVRHEMTISHSCGGMGTCGTCRVEIEVYPLDYPEPSDVELEFASERGFRANERLACQIPSEPNLKLRLPSV